MGGYKRASSVFCTLVKTDKACCPTFGAHTMCFPGTGSVVMYMVTQRYM